MRTDRFDHRCSVEGRRESCTARGTTVLRGGKPHGGRQSPSVRTLELRFEGSLRGPACVRVHPTHPTHLTAHSRTQRIKKEREGEES